MAIEFYLDGSLQSPTGATDKAKLANLLAGGAVNDGGTHRLEIAGGKIAVGDNAGDTFAIGALSCALTIADRVPRPSRFLLFDNGIRDAVLADMSGFSTAGANANPLWIQQGAHDLTFEDLAFTHTLNSGTTPSSTLINKHLIEVGTQTLDRSQPSSRSGLPYNITFDRCCVNAGANAAVNSSRWGFFLNGANLAVRRSNVSGWRMRIGDSWSAQGDHGAVWFGGVDGAVFEDNYCETGGERWFCGQTVVTPYNVRVLRNVWAFPEAWVDVVAVKNGGEYKNLRHGRVIGNYIERIKAFSGGDQNYACISNLRTEPAITTAGDGVAIPSGVHITDNQAVGFRYQCNIVNGAMGGLGTACFDGDSGATWGYWGRGPIVDADYSHNLFLNIDPAVWGDPNHNAYVGLLWGSEHVRIANNYFGGDPGSETGRAILLYMFDNRTAGTFVGYGGGGYGLATPGYPRSDRRFTPRSFSKFRHLNVVDNLFDITTYGIYEANSNSTTVGVAVWNLMTHRPQIECNFRGNVIGEGPFVTWGSLMTGGVNFLDTSKAAFFGELVDPANNDVRIKAISAYRTKGIGGACPGPDHEALKATCGPWVWAAAGMRY